MDFLQQKGIQVKVIPGKSHTIGVSPIPTAFLFLFSLLAKPNQVFFWFNSLVVVLVASQVSLLPQG